MLHHQTGEDGGDKECGLGLLGKVKGGPTNLQLPRYPPRHHGEGEELLTVSRDLGQGASGQKVWYGGLAEVRENSPGGPQGGEQGTLCQPRHRGEVGGQQCGGGVEGLCSGCGMEAVWTGR